jgi:hypothetical protein
MTDADLLLWDCEDAPSSLRRLVPTEYSNGWLAYIPPGSALELIEFLFSFSNSHQGAILRFESEDGGIVLLGARASVPPIQNDLAENGLDFDPQPPRRTRLLVRMGGRFDPPGSRGC